MYCISAQRLLIFAALVFANKSSAVAEMGDRLATIDMGRKVGGCCAPILGDRRRSKAEETAERKHYGCAEWPFAFPFTPNPISSFPFPFP